MTDTVWAGGIPLNLVGGESALKSVLNLDANTRSGPPPLRPPGPPTSSPARFLTSY